jgi:aryl carrier-like protein
MLFMSVNSSISITKIVEIKRRSFQNIDQNELIEAATLLDWASIIRNQ